ncbi:MAG: hypothetical protein HW380_3329 [Magnetococcales bacterium]|nr:hypothetical protein [Magnetococcales bacterium]
MLSARFLCNENQAPVVTGAWQYLRADESYRQSAFPTLPVAGGSGRIHAKRSLPQGHRFPGDRRELCYSQIFSFLGVIIFSRRLWSQG